MFFYSAFFVILHPTMDEDTQYNFISKQINVLFYYQNMQYQNIDLKILVWVTDNSSVQIREN